jgi:hypothetical protein
MSEVYQVSEKPGSSSSSSCKWLGVFCQPQCVGLQWSSSTSICVMILSSNSEAELHVALRQRRYGDKRYAYLDPNAQNHKANKLHCRRDAFRSTDTDSEQRNKRSLIAGNGQNGKNWIMRATPRQLETESWRASGKTIWRPKDQKLGHRLSKIRESKRRMEAAMSSGDSSWHRNFYNRTL